MHVEARPTPSLILCSEAPRASSRLWTDTAAGVAPKIPEFRAAGIYVVSGGEFRILISTRRPIQVYDYIEKKMVDATGIEPVTPSV